MFESIFKILNIALIVIYYEEFLDAPQKIIAQIGHTLGIDELTYCASNIRYKKQANKLNDSLIEKFRQEFKF
ncbi:Stf0 family sulfotransferase [Nitrosomonas communis]|uniref:Stf0 family sulfotransferase n=1 Tax=Nitrosomonas communis TaxID=44574 RepID=UPI003D2CC8E9